MSTEMESSSEKQLPSQINQVKVICRHELRKFLRSKRVIGVIVVAVLASVAVVNFIVNVFDTDSRTGLLGLSLLLGPLLLIITAALVGSDALLVEFHEKTGYSLFPNPVTRTSIWFGKFLAAEIIVFIVIAIYFGVITAAALIQFKEALPTAWIEPMLFSIVLGTLVMSIAFLWSAIFKGPLAATITTLFSLVILPIADVILSSQQLDTWFMPYSAANNVITSLAFLDRDLLIENAERSIPIIASLFVVLAYIIGFSALSIYLFRRRDM